MSTASMFSPTHSDTCKTFNITYPASTSESIIITANITTFIEYVTASSTANVVGQVNWPNITSSSRLTSGSDDISVPLTTIPITTGFDTVQPITSSNPSGSSISSLTATTARSGRTSEGGGPVSIIDRASDETLARRPSSASTQTSIAASPTDTTTRSLALERLQGRTLTGGGVLTRRNVLGCVLAVSLILRLVVFAMQA